MQVAISENKSAAARHAAGMSASPRPCNGAEAVVQALVECGVDTLFGYPGGAALPLYDALFDERID